MMATYNGEKYIEQQIESILNQNSIELTLWISDDGSNDQTVAICEKYARKYKNVFFRANECNKGLAKNFMDMVYDADLDRFSYYAFSDQDDYWQQDKIISAVSCLKEFDQQAALYYSDITNVDKNLSNASTTILSSYFSLETKPYIPLIVNWAYGCTMVFNKSMAKLLCVHKLSNFLRFHDSWVHLVASTCGICISDRESSHILRRISGENAFGDKNLTLSFERVFSAVQALFSCNHHITETLKELKRGYHDYIDSERMDELENLLIMRYSMRQRISMAFSSHIKLPSARETYLLKLRILFNLL